jgi:metal-sulfur cluster biosynthetic enzyme/ribosomal protein L22
MSTTLTVEWQVDEPQLRVTQRDAQTALRVIAGQPVVAARARLRLGPGRTCEPVARLLDRAIVRAEDAGLDPKRLVVADGSAQAAEDIIRVRRKAHGVADWIHSPTCRVRIILRPAGLYATASRTVSADLPEPLQPPEPPEPPVAAAAPADERTAAVYEALSDVIDPDLGVNIVDLGFVRAVEIRGQTAVITMTLTSAACPLSRIMEDQIRAGLDQLAPLDRLEGFRVDWQWVPAWRPGDITESGREQLRAIGFSFKDE